MATLAEYYTEIGVHGVNDVLGAFGRVKAGLASMASAATSPIRSLGGVLTGLASPVGLVTTALGAAGVAGAGGVMKLAAETESLGTQFRVLLGSGEAAKAMLADINKFAAATPFEQMELGSVAKQLLAYGTASGDIIPTMRKLGDIAALSGARLGDLASIYGKVQGRGKMEAETLAQFQERGIPITRELAAVLGVAESQVAEFVSKGKVGFPQVQQAIARLTGEGGQFAGGMEQLSKTTGGLWSTVTGNLKTALAELGTQLIETFNIKDKLGSLGDWLGGMTERIRGFFDEWQPAMEQAFSTMTAWWNTTWEVASGILGAIGDFFGSIFGKYMTGTMAESVTAWLSEVEFFFDNWKLYLAIGLAEADLFFENLWTRVKATFENSVWAAKWAFGSWSQYFQDFYDTVAQGFRNLMDLLTMGWSTFLKWFKAESGPLGDAFKEFTGFASEFTGGTKTRTSTPELDAMYEELNRKRQEFYAKEPPKLPDVPEPPKPPGSPQPPPGAPGPSVAAVGGISFVGLSALANQMQQEAGKRLQEQMKKAAEDTASGIGKMAGAVEGNRLRVEVVGGPSTFSTWAK